jgi:addiction module HigA family antidote
LKFPINAQVHHVQEWHATYTSWRSTPRGLPEIGLSAAGLARALGVATPTVNNIPLERGGVSADMALRLAACLDTTPEFWLNLHKAHERRKAEQEHGEEIAEVVQRLVA